MFPPSKTKQYEVGGKLTLGGMGLSLAAYQTDQPSAFAVNGVYGLYGVRRNRGVEFSVSGEVMPGLRVIGGGSLNEAKLRSTGVATLDGNTAPGVPSIWSTPMSSGTCSRR